MNKQVKKQLRPFSFSKFSLLVHNTIAKKFPQTYFVGGAVRNQLLGVKKTSADIATVARPAQTKKLLSGNNIKFSDAHEKFGVIVAKQGREAVEVATFRTERYEKSSRFPEVKFVKSAKSDSNRRDFTINAVYYDPGKKQLLDFHDGQRDAAKKVLKFIGLPQKRITEDPLRIVRAFRFSVRYNLRFDTKTKQVLQKNLLMLKKVSKTRLQREINEIKNKNLRKTLQKVIHSNT
jgi:tRNA nucleotidyltransferase/poly(A) polymerase